MDHPDMLIDSILAAKIKRQKTMMNFSHVAPLKILHLFIVTCES